MENCNCFVSSPPWLENIPKLAFCISRGRKKAVVASGRVRSVCSAVRLFAHPMSTATLATTPERIRVNAESSLIPKREFGNEGNSTGFPAHERAAGQGIGACRRCRLARGGALIYKWPVSSSPDDPFYLHTDAPPNPRGG
jgi:hypothetical protein